jgi:DHA2 family lincomycin resistance protein-like MFS transporter
MFTPLFTASLGALPPHLYSHGSAVLGTTQQVAGAAGTAFFVAIMSYESAKLGVGGATKVAALAGGIHTSFGYCTVIAVLGIFAAAFVREKKIGSQSAGSGPSH